MKLVLLIGCMLIGLGTQLFFLQGLQTGVIVANILIAFLVMVSLYATREQMLWMALACGLLSDLYSSVDFGFYLGFYLLLAIVCKYLLKFGETERSWWRPLMVIALAATLQAVLVSLPLLALNLGWGLAQNLLSFVLFTVIAGGFWYLILNFLDEFSKNLPKFSR